MQAVCRASPILCPWICYTTWLRRFGHFTVLIPKEKYGFVATIRGIFGNFAYGHQVCPGI